LSTLVIWLVGALGLASAFGAYTLYERNQAANAAVASLQAAQAKADAELAAKDALAVKAAEQDITNMQAAYDAGESKAKTVTQKIYIRGQANVAKDSGLSNPVCVMSADSLQYLRSALSGMRTAADPGGEPAAVPGPGITNGRDVRQPVPQQPQEHGALGPVHANAPTASSTRQVSGSGVPGNPRPKPKPVQ